MNFLRNRWLWAGGVLVLALAGLWAFRALRSDQPEYRTATVGT
jgi:hypothetical protein